MDERGHHFALTHAITAGALQNGLRVIWYTNKAFKPALKMDGVVTKAIFERSTYDRFRKQETTGSVGIPAWRQPSAWISRFALRVRNSIAYRWAKFRGKLPVDESPTNTRANETSTPRGMAILIAAALDEGRIGRDDHVLVHTTDGDMYRAVLELVLQGRLDDSFPTVHLVTPYDATTMPDYARGVPVDRVVRYLKLFKTLNRRVFLYGEHKLLADHLSECWQVEVHALPIPPPADSLADNSRPDGPLTVAYLGAAREEKGFLLLPDVVEQCVAQLGAGVRFVFQCSPQIVGYTPAIEAAIARLRQHPKGRVRLISTSQSMDEYLAVLKTSDIVLACYDADKYRVRGSGIAVEALAFGNTLIATPDTSPAAIAGVAAVTAASIEEIVARIAEISADREAYAARASAARSEYLQRNSASVYVAKLLEVGDNSPGETIPDSNVPAKTSPQALRSVPAENWEAVLTRAVNEKQALSYDFEPGKLLGRSEDI